MIDPAPASAAGNVLEVRGVSVGFDGFTVLDNLDFSMCRGELRFLIGPNGAGKTTLLDVITAKTRPDRGRIVFDGTVDLVGKREAQVVRLGIGRKFQTPAVFRSLTVAQNLEVAAGFRGGLFGLFRPLGREPARRVQETLVEVGLAGRADVTAGALSHGERQWLEIGVLIVQDLQLLLLDEPVAGMTRAERDRTGALLRRIARQRSVLVVEHDMTFVRQFGDVVTVLHLGRRLAEGPVAAVQSDPRVIEVYLGRDHARQRVRPTAAPEKAGAAPVPAPAVESAPVLAVEGLAVGYGESIVVSGVDLSVRPGQVACLMGRNGVGKTTLLKALMGVLPVRQGRVSYNGADLTLRPAYERARRGIGYVPQGRGVFPYLTVRDNLIMGLEGAPPGARTAPEVAVRLGESFALFPVLETMQRRRAGTLSGGQQQQLAIARALISHPTLLLLDEPTEGIQPSIIDEIEALLRALRQRRAVSILLVEQFLDFALGVADYCYVMEKGSIVSQGTADSLSDSVVREHLSV